ncbi:hypothetical protein [Deinococcus arcticus]|uniref:Uncharacterized protein n=1 Tax=Deinococcus arcticus TaxID=2136176 RepID=A0A2T3WB03_9DEIO|nr:hypothetical protein [Deinococcus arcticus]PTA69091.1 hypothetical protein C8263_04695 [Deinococcus arcticus]
MTIPAGFARKLARLGVARVRLAYLWHEDEMRYEVQALDGQGRAVPLDHDTRREVEEAVEHADLPSQSAYLWDLSTGVITPFGEVTYLAGDSLNGTYTVRFEGNEELVLAVAAATAPSQAQVQEWVAHPDPSVRRAAALNPAIPDEWLRPLHGDLVFEVASAVHSRGGRAAFEAERQQAQNPQTLPRTLDALSRSPWASVRLAAARNPSTPGSALRELARAPQWPFPLAVLNNPACPPEVREPLLNALGGVEAPETRRAIAQAQDAPWALLSRWLDDPDPYLRARIARHAATPTEALARLATDPDEDVQMAVQERTEEEPYNPAWPLAEQWRVAHSPLQESALWALGHAPNLHPEVLAFLLNQPPQAYVVLHRPEVTDDDLLRLIETGPIATHWLSERGGLSARVLRRLAQRPEAHLRASVPSLARPTGLPGDVTAALVADPSDQVRAQAALHLPLSPAQAQELADDPAAWVAETLLRNPALPPEVARTVLRRLGPGTLNPYLHTGDPLPGPLLGVYSEFATGETLLALAQNPQTPSSPLVDRMRALGGAAIETLIAEPQTPPGVLARLVVSPHDGALLRHPSFTEAMLRDLITQRLKRFSFWNSLRDEDRLVMLVLDSPHMTLDLWEELVTPRNLQPEIRAQVAARPDLPPRIAARLAEDPVGTVVAALRRNPAVPPEVVNRLDGP